MSEEVDVDKGDGCDNCGRPRGSGGADGLCGRCYRYRGRHNKLPPRELLKGSMGEVLVLRLDADMLRGLQRRARDERTDVSKVARDILGAALR